MIWDIIRAFGDAAERAREAGFDALHAVVCGDEHIISSDKVFEKIGIERIEIEH